MSCCDDGCGPGGPTADPRYRRVLWAVLVLNAAMFGIELAAGLMGDSVSLQADAIDFLGDAATYGLTLLVLDMTLAWRARAALVKGATMGLFGLWIIGMSAWTALAGSVPQAATMGTVGAAALVINVLCAILLFAWREGDANMRSVWLCSRNDAIGNVAVIAAGAGVFATGTPWPDLTVAAVMAGLALSSSWKVLRHARAEHREAVTAAAE